MAQSKNLLKGTPRNKSVELTNSDNNSSGSTTSDKSVQSTNQSNISTTNIDAADNKLSLYQMQGLTFSHVLFILHLLMSCNAHQRLNFVQTSFQNR